MYRILVGKIVHETNTFSPLTTDLQNFQNQLYMTGDSFLHMGSTKTATQAFVDVLRHNGVEIVMNLVTSASPSGTVKNTCLERLKAELLQPLQNGRVDGVLLSLHGAMASETEPDADGDILEAVRTAVGADVPVMAALDLHVNLTQKMMDNATALLPCRSYPHTDLYEAAMMLARLMLRTLNGEISPCMAWRQLPILAALAETDTAAFAPIETARRAIENTDGVIVARVAHGCFFSDTADTGASVLTISDRDPTLAQKTADRLAKTVWEHRSCFDKAETYTPEQAITDAAKQNGLCVFADICDNPGGGSAGEGTTLLRAMLNAGVTNAAFGIICDAQTVAQCHEAGVGSQIDIRLGGKRLPDCSGAPIECRAQVCTLTDGWFTKRGPMAHGSRLCVGRTAAIRIDGITVIVTERAIQIYDPGIFLSHGLLPEDFHIFAVKSAMHYRAAFAPISAKLYPVECRGMVPTDPNTLTYHRLKRKMYPIDRDAEFT